MHLRSRVRRVALVALTLCACKSESGLVERRFIDRFEQSPTDQADVLFVVDNSHSMVEEQAAIVSGFDAFMAHLLDTETDFHLGVISTSLRAEDPNRAVLKGTPAVLTRDTPDYASLFRNRVQMGTQGDDQEKGLAAAALALSPEMTVVGAPNADLLRQDAFLMIVFVSDEDDCSDDGALAGLAQAACYDSPEALVPVSAYVTDYLRVVANDTSRLRVGGIVGPPAWQHRCDDTTPGHRYLALAGFLGGVTGDVCDSDYDAVLDRMGLAATGMVDRFELSHPARPDSLEVSVGDASGDAWDVVEDPNDGYSFDAATGWITVYGAAIPPRGGQLTVSYIVNPN